LKKLESYNKDNVKLEIVEQVKPILESDAFTDKNLKNASAAAFGIGKWCRAIV